MISVCHGTACHVKGSELIQDALRAAPGASPTGEDTDADGLLHRREGGLPGLLHAGPGGPDRRRHLRPPDARHGRRGAATTSCEPQTAAAQRAAARPTAPPAATAGRDPHRPGLLLRGPGQRQGPPGDRRGAGRDRRAGRGQAGGLRGHVPPDAAGRGRPAAAGRRAVTPRSSADDAAAIVLRHFQPRGLVRRHRLRGRRLARPAADRRGWATRSTRYAHRRPRRAGVRVPRAGSSTSPPSTAASSTRSTWTSTCATTASRPCGSASSELTPEEIIERGAAERPARPRRGRLPHRAQVGRASAPPPATKKYVICNGDEGDPGAFMDRMLLESFPYRVIEGMAIAARAVGADEGIFYIRAEYPLAVERIREALRQLRGARPAGRPRPGQRLPPAPVGQGRGGGVRLRRGDGAAGLARRPPRHAAAPPALPGRERPVGQAHLVNNVETYALVPWIFRHGAGGLRRAGHREEQGHQGLRPGRQGRAAAG